MAAELNRIHHWSSRPAIRAPRRERVPGDSREYSPEDPIHSRFGSAALLQAANAPVALDLSPSSAAVQTLNSTATLATVATRATARVYIAADFWLSPRHPLVHATEQLRAISFERAMDYFRGIASSLLALHLLPGSLRSKHFSTLWSNAYRWGNVANDMLDIFHPYWLDMIGAFRVSGGQALYDSSDGIVPVKSAVLLGSTRSFRTGSTTHCV